MDNNTVIVSEPLNAHAETFFNNIEKMRNPHIRDYGTCSERFGKIEDYSELQEQKDLKRYYHFINSSAYDDIKNAESELTLNENNKKLTLTLLRKISSYHDDV